MQLYNGIHVQYIYHRPQCHDGRIIQRTFEKIPAPRLCSLNTVPKEIISLPEIRIRNLIRHKLLHRSPQLRVPLQVGADVLGLLVNVKFLRPRCVLFSSRILGKAFRVRVNDVQLGIESRSMNNPFSLSILALEQDGARSPAVAFRSGRWCNAD